MALRSSVLEEFVVEFFKRLLIVSFGLFLFENPTMIFTILQGFRDASTQTVQASGSDFSNISVEASLLLLPIEIFGSMIANAGKINFLSFDLAFVIPIVIASVLVFWALAVAGLQLILVLCEAFIVLTIGMFFLAFYSLSFTREYTMKYFSAVVGIGVKLLTLELIIFLIFQLVRGWKDILYIGR